MSVYPALRYRDPKAAIAFLVDAFGFTEKSVMIADDGSVGHAELAWPDPSGPGGLVMIGQVSGGSGGGSATFDTARVVTYLTLDDPDSHCKRAVAAGAEIVMEPTDQPYGSRDYAASDPEGNVWCFGTYRP
jgi:uncharacterized glyoxalase superfamily protein PhnB